MNYLVLGCKIEYEQAAKRLEKVAHAKPGTLEEQQRKKLLAMFVQFERDIKKI